MHYSWRLLCSMFRLYAVGHLRRIAEGGTTNRFSASWRSKSCSGDAKSILDLANSHQPLDPSNAAIRHRLHAVQPLALAITPRCHTQATYARIELVNTPATVRARREEAATERHRHGRAVLHVVRIERREVQSVA